MGVGEQRMRVVGGRWRSRRIEAPPGRTTRPTSDRVREAVFSAVEARIGALDGIRALDLFAGSGALGIEALSRGAEHVTFVESDRRAAACIRRNLASLGAAPEAATVICGPADAPHAAVRTAEPVALLFLDPPYRIEASRVTALLERLRDSGAIAPGALVVWEHAAGAAVVWPDAFRAEPPRRYGATEVTFGWYEE